MRTDKFYEQLDKIDMSCPEKLLEVLSEANRYSKDTCNSFYSINFSI